MTIDLNDEPFVAPNLSMNELNDLMGLLDELIINNQEIFEITLKRVKELQEGLDRF